MPSNAHRTHTPFGSGTFLVCRQAYSSIGKPNRSSAAPKASGARAKENRHVAGIHIFQDLVDLVLRIINIVDTGSVYVCAAFDFFGGYDVGDAIEIVYAGYDISANAFAIKRCVELNAARHVGNVPTEYFHDQSS